VFRGALLIVLLVAGCASEPPRVPSTLSRTGAAVVRAWSPGDVRIEAVDGVEIGKVSHVLVSSGEHQLTVRWSGGQGVTRVGQVRAVVQAGNSYVVEAEPDGALRTVLFSVVDKGPGYDEQCLQQSFFSGTPKGRGC
jgi:hypothetical protein